MALETGTQLASPDRLARNSIGLPHIVFFVLAAAAPLTAVVGGTPGAFAFGNGPGVPGAFLIVGCLYLLFTVGFTAMMRHVKGCGAFYTYIANGIGKPAGVGAAMMAIVTYNSVQIAIYALAGIIVSGALAPMGVEVPWWSVSLTAIVLVTICGQRNVAFSGNILGVCLIAEVAILLLLDIAILVGGGGPEGIGFSSFSPSVVVGPGLGLVLVFVVASFIGFEATAIFSEEARNADRTIARATYVAIIIIGGFYAFTTWCVVQLYGPSKIAETAKANLETLYLNAAGAVLGHWAVNLINILLIISLFACVLSFHNTVSRYFYAMGREQIAHKALGKVHPKHGSPSVAGFAQSAVAAIIILAFVLGGQDPYTIIFLWMSALAVMGIVAIQALVCIAVVMYFRANKSEFGAWQTVVAPSLSFVGLLACLVLIVKNLSTLAGSDSPLVMSFPYLMAAVGICGVAFAYWLKSARPSLYANLGRAFE